MHNIKKNKIHIALNFNLFSCILNNEINLNNNCVLWPDGIFSKFLFKNCKIIPGREYLNEVLTLASKNCVKINFIGTLNDLSRSFLRSRNVTFTNYDPGFINNYLNLQIPNYVDNDLVILLLPTPKQEILAEMIYLNSKCTIFCFGGALNMLCGNERVTPSFFCKFGCEWLWRLLVGGVYMFKKDLSIMLKFLRNLSQISCSKKIIVSMDLVC